MVLVTLQRDARAVGTGARPASNAEASILEFPSTAVPARGQDIGRKCQHRVSPSPKTHERSSTCRKRRGLTNVERSCGRHAGVGRTVVRCGVSLGVLAIDHRNDHCRPARSVHLSWVEASRPLVEPWDGCLPSWFWRLHSRPLPCQRVFSADSVRQVTRSLEPGRSSASGRLCRSTPALRAWWWCGCWRWQSSSSAVHVRSGWSVFTPIARGIIALGVLLALVGIIGNSTSSGEIYGFWEPRYGRRSVRPLRQREPFCWLDDHGTPPGDRVLVRGRRNRDAWGQAGLAKPDPCGSRRQQPTNSVS